MSVSSNSEKSGKFPLRRVISFITLLIAIVVLLLAMKTPAPLASKQPAAAITANAMSFQAKVDQLAQSQTNSGPDATAEVRLTADEISAAMAQANGSREPSSAAEPSAAQVSDEPPVITLDGDVVKGQFASEIGGKRVYVTVAGHLGAKDGYATFDPTEFKVGDLNVPVSLVNSALQKKLLEQRDQLKLPDFVGDLKIENGELVVKPK
jgi:hypothetical protein